MAGGLPGLLGGELPAPRRAAGRRRGRARRARRRCAIHALTVTAENDRDLVLSRAFAAPRARVFDAFTRPGLLVRWYGARGWHLVACDVDLRRGGAYRFVSRGPDAAEMTQRGVFREVTPSERLVMTERFDDQSYPGDTLITHEFTERDGTTTVRTRVRYATPEGRAKVLTYPMARGVGEAHERLDAVLRELTPETVRQDQNEMREPS